MTYKEPTPRWQIKKIFSLRKTPTRSTALPQKDIDASEYKDKFRRGKVMEQIRQRDFQPDTLVELQRLSQKTNPDGNVDTDKLIWQDVWSVVKGTAEILGLDTTLIKGKQPTTIEERRQQDLFEYLHSHAEELKQPDSDLIRNEKLYEPEAYVFPITATRFSPPLNVLVAHSFTTDGKISLFIMLSMSAPDRLENQVILDLCQKFKAVGAPVKANDFYPNG